MDDQSVLDICCGEGGILSSITAGKLHINLTAIKPVTADMLQLEHEKVGCHYISAPVVGRPDAAAAGKLITFLALPAPEFVNYQYFCFIRMET